VSVENIFLSVNAHRSTAQGDLAGALSAYEESKAIAERLAASDPSNAGWQRDLVVSLWKLSADGLAAPRDAREYLKRVLEILDALDAAGRRHGDHSVWSALVRQRLQALDTDSTLPETG
jgi:hypothetical protein